MKDLIKFLQAQVTALQKKLQSVDEIIINTPNDSELGAKIRKEWAK
jgi:23S rRNA G2445 N2-methylase RlmL